MTSATNFQSKKKNGTVNKHILVINVIVFVIVFPKVVLTTLELEYFWSYFREGCREAVPLTLS